MSSGELLIVDPLELKFQFELNKHISCTIQASNQTDNHVAFKVKTTNPKKYCVRPNTGVILPRSSSEIMVTMQAQKEAPIDMQCKDKFLLQSIVTSPDTNPKDITPEMFSKDQGRVEECKLKVVYVAPPQTSSPAVEGLMMDNSNEATLVSKLTEEKEAAIERSNKLRQELEQMKKRKNFAIKSAAEEEDGSKKFTSKNSHLQSSLPSLRNVFLLCLVTRLVNSLLVQTYFNPDEHWQALEVAHQITFGYGHLTWEWKKGIRSYLHPLLFAALYKILAFLRLDTPFFMIRSPRLFQSIFAAFGDLYAYKFSQVLFGGDVPKWVLFTQLTNWFLFFCMPRTFSNSLETVLTIVSLYYWPCMRASTSANPSGSRKYALVIAAIACALRPTSAITWIYVGCLELSTTRDKLKFLLLEVIPVGGLVLGFTFLFDYQFYGLWVIVPLNFLKFNFLSPGGDYYGTHPWHWYFTQGFTVMLFTYIPFTVAGIIKSKEWKLSGLVVWVLAIYSLLGHKEFRFVLPVLPVALMFSGYSLAEMTTKGGLNSRTKCCTKLQLGVLFLLVTNIPMALYMSMIHQRGTEDVMNYLAKEAREDNVESILFLMPCHATPYYSTLHRDLPMRFLDCTPSDEKGILDESDRFLEDPVGFATELARNWSVPTHIVLFDSQEKLLKEFLLSHHFKEVRRFFHSHFKVDRELQAYVVLYVLQG